MKKLLLAIGCLAVMISMSSCTADNINENSNNKAADNYIDPGIDPLRPPH